LDSLCASELWSGIRDASGSNQTQGKDLRFISLSPFSKPIHRPRILIVEDNAGDLFLIRDALRAATIDADIDVVQDGQDAMRYFDAKDADFAAPSPNIVLLDLNLPKRSGAEVLKHLRSSKRCGEALVLIVSSSDATRDRTAVAELDVAGYFRKPSDYTDFMKLGPLVKAMLTR